MTDGQEAPAKVRQVEDLGITTRRPKVSSQLHHWNW